MTACVGTRSGLLDQTFRANPAYQFVPFRRFVAGERELIDDLARDADVHGILRPRSRTTLGVKAATRSLAALLRVRQSPGALPERLRRNAPEAAADEIARLVLDGILEVERNGEFVSGAGADHLLDAHDSADSAHPLEALSLAAVRYGEALDIESPGSLSARVYFYNRIPVSPRWARRLPAAESVLEFLGLSAGSELRQLVNRRWAQGSSNDLQGWLTWNPRDARLTRSKEAPVHKIYVSPMPGDLPGALRFVVHALSQCGQTAFKVGAGVDGLLRPDKLVIYLSSASEFEDVAHHLRRSLDGMSSHGVPFTASIDATGLLSRGIDPPRNTRILSWRENESWRLWVTNRIAVYLLTARATRTRTTTLTGAQFAIARLRLDGVDTRQWTPDTIGWARQPSERQ